MKKVLSFAILSGILFMGISAKAQDDKSKRPSPPAQVSVTTENGATITINYSQPSVKGRTIGKDLEPMQGKVWRTGANEATIFEIDKDVTVDGNALKAGKYGFFTIWNGDSWTLIFNKTAEQWGAFKYSETDDALRVNVKNVKPEQSADKLTFTADKSGQVNAAWGDVGFSFTVK